MSDNHPSSEGMPGHEAFAALGWAFFLAASWTWCIGMFIPVLLIRDFGGASWLVFAVPNVVGALGMAWVLRDARASLRLAWNHETAAIAFSFVTISFHVFFTVWLLRAMVGTTAYMAFAGAVVFLVILLYARVADRVLSIVVILISVVAITSRSWAVDPAQLVRPISGDLWMLAPVCMFGFLLCPYLDLTFHRARQSTSPGGGRFAFSFGFAVPFLGMIALTAMYTPVLIAWMKGAEVSRPLLVALATHMILQTAITMSLHGREIVSRISVMSPSGFGAMLWWLVAVAFATKLFVGSGLGVTSMGESAYRVFMGFYGLVFPAYVWICVVPNNGLRPSRAQWIIFVISVAIAMPMYWLGFVDQKMIWLLPGVGVVLVAGVVVRRFHPAPLPHIADR